MTKNENSGNPKLPSLATIGVVPGGGGQMAAMHPPPQPAQRPVMRLMQIRCFQEIGG